MTFSRMVILLGLLFVLSIASISVNAQATDSSCPALVQTALSTIGNSCGNLPRNSACYGFNRVTANFTEDFGENFFTQPSDLAQLSTVKRIETAPLDLATQQWGIAVMNVQANVPDTLPGQAVTFLLMGNGELENAVDTDGSTVRSVTVITQTGAELFAAPDLSGEPVGVITPGMVVEADAISPDGTSVYLTAGTLVGWAARSALNANPLLDNLPPEPASTQSPMQSFYFRTRPGLIECSQTPSTLMIQSPENIKVNLTANGAEIELGSIIVLQVLADGQTMQLITLVGEAVLNPGTENEIRVPAGYTSSHCLAEAQSLGVDGEANDLQIGQDCAWEEPRQATITELEIGQTGQAILERVRSLTSGPSIVLTPTQEVELTATPTPVTTDVPTLTPTPSTVDCPAGTTLTHTVSAGENLFRISLRYATSIGAIMQANGLTDPQRIFAGQVLTIPCGVDSGLPSVPPEQPSIEGTFVFPGILDCGTFRPTSPLDGFNYGSNTLYWDPFPGATGYRVNIYNIDEANGRQVASYTVNGTQTSITVDLTVETVGYGFSFAWDVQAVVNGLVVCTTPRVTIPRGSPPQGASNPSSSVTVPPPSFSVAWGCSGTFTYQVTFSGLPAGTTSVTVNYVILAGLVTPPPAVTSVPPDPGSVVFTASGIGTIGSGTVTANPSGATVTLPGTLSC